MDGGLPANQEELAGNPDREGQDGLYSEIEEAVLQAIQVPVKVLTSSRCTRS